MAKTGFHILDWLPWPALVLAGLAAFILLFRKGWQDNFRVLLLVAILLTGLLQILLIVLPASEAGQKTIRFVFGQASFMLLFFMLKTALHSRWLDTLLNYFFVVLLSVSSTLIILSNPSFYSVPLSLAEAGMLILLSILVLVQVIREQFIFIFHTAFFWIAGGTLAVGFLMVLREIIRLTAALPEKNWQAWGSPLLSGIMDFLLTAAYLAAALSGTRKKDEWDIPSF